VAVDGRGSVVSANIRLLLPETYLLSNVVNVWILDGKYLGLRGEHVTFCVQAGIAFGQRRTV
jgi:hypothetical protein